MFDSKWCYGRSKTFYNNFFNEVSSNKPCKECNGTGENMIMYNMHSGYYHIICSSCKGVGFEKRKTKNKTKIKD